MSTLKLERPTLVFTIYPRSLNAFAICSEMIVSEESDLLPVDCTNFCCSAYSRKCFNPSTPLAFVLLRSICED